MLDRFLSTLSVVSRIPIKGRFKFDCSRMDFYLPVTGFFPALAGLLLFGAASVCFGFKDNPASGIPGISAILILTAQYLGFNLFHLDGLMDTADAFLGPGDKEKRLLILKDSRVGVYGFFAGAAALGLKTALLGGLLPFARDFPALVFAYPLWGRFSAALVPCVAKPLKPGGLGVLARDARPYRCFLGLGFALLLWLPLSGFAARPGVFPPSPAKDALPALILWALSLLVICPLAAFFYAGLYKKSLGGYTGDTLGAAVETAEILYGITALAVLA